MRLLIFIFGNVLALFLASYYIEGMTLEGGFWTAVMIGTVFSLINFILKPILKLILSPFILLTFGLLIIVINMGMLKLTDWAFPQLEIISIGSLFLGTLLIGAVNIVVHILFRR